MTKLREWLKGLDVMWVAAIALAAAFSLGLGAATYVRLPEQVGTNTVAIQNLDRRTKTLADGQKILADNQQAMVELLARQLCLDVADKQKTDWRRCMQQDLESLLKSYDIGLVEDIP